MQWLGNVDLNKRTLGNSIGKDIGGALNSLAEHKTKNLVNKEKSKLWHSLGVDKDTAQSLMHQPESIQKAFFDRWDSQPQQNAQQAQQQPQQDIQPSFTPEQTNLLKSIANPMDRQKAAQGFIQQNKAQVPQQSPNEQIGQVAGQQVLDQSNKGNLRPADYAEQKKENREIAKEERKFAHEREMYELKKSDESIKESKKWYAEEHKKSHSLKENLGRLNRMEELNKSGKLPHNTLVSLKNAVAEGVGIWAGGAHVKIPGINLSHIIGEEGEEFDKLSKDMLSGLKDIYGGRINQMEVESFLKTIPSLDQSPQGRQAVIENMRMLTEGKLLAQKEAQKIKEENGGKIPPDLQELVEERISPQLDAISERFKNLSHDKVKKGDNFATSTLKGVSKLLV